MTSQAKAGKITRETARARKALQAGADPADVGMCAYTRGWASALTGPGDECLGRKAGWIARFERGSRDAQRHLLALASDAPADNACGQCAVDGTSDTECQHNWETVLA
jgi:hypothetical protein